MDDTDVVQEMAELKALMGKLWKSVDASNIQYQKDTQKVVEKIEQWIQINQILLHSNQRLLEASVTNSEAVQKSSHSFERGLDAFRDSKIQLVKSQALTNQLTENLVKSQGSQKALQDIRDRIHKLNLPKSKGLRPIWSAESIVALVLSGVIAIGLVGYFYWTAVDLRVLKEQTNLTLLKLQKLEQK